MNHATLVRMCEAGANLFEIEERSLKRQRPSLRECKHISAGQILEHNVVKSRAGEIDGRAVSETVYDIRMANAIERDCFVLKIGDECTL